MMQSGGEKRAADENEVIYDLLIIIYKFYFFGLLFP